MNIMMVPRVRRRIRENSKKWYPKEFFCFLLGRVTKSAIWIEDIWVPPDLEAFSTKDCVEIPEKWWQEVANGPLFMVGDYHSHPDWQTCALSEEDQDHIQAIKTVLDTPFVVGIGGVYRHKETKKVKCRTRFWPYA